MIHEMGTIFSLAVVSIRHRRRRQATSGMNGAEKHHKKSDLLQMKQNTRKREIHANKALRLG